MGNNHDLSHAHAYTVSVINYSLDLKDWSVSSDEDTTHWKFVLLWSCGHRVMMQPLVCASSSNTSRQAPYCSAQAVNTCARRRLPCSHEGFRCRFHRDLSVF